MNTAYMRNELTDSGYDIIVIGGGAAGMMAAVFAAEQGACVAILERNAELGKKLKITGKGRCNVTNHCTAEEALAEVPRNGKFLYHAMTEFPPARTMEFFERNGCPLKTERGNRVFPVSDRSASICGVMRAALDAAHVQIIRQRVTEILTEDGMVCGLKMEDGRRLSAQAVVLATGGCSYPATGSTGDGYRMAQAVGHTIQQPRGSLVPLEAEEDCAKMQGLSLRNVRLRLLDQKGKRVYEDFGEMLFTHFGVSGPIVLSASAHMKPGCPYELRLDLKSALDEKKLDARVLRDLETYKNRTMENALCDLLPRKMIPVVLERLEISPSLQANALTRQARQRVVHLLKDFPIRITGMRPVEEAIVTAGGVRVKEVNPQTMESRMVHGLYFSGEILDCDAYTGGFNLQIAWATGYIAGKSAAELCAGRSRNT